MRKRESRWKTHFGRWVTNRGVRVVVRDLHALGEPVGSNAVYNWISGARLPRPSIALRLVELSAGQLTLSDIYDHRQQANAPAVAGVSRAGPAGTVGRG